ncbi:MAG: malate synthase G, partial [SAR324 cluster bacterium]|nr:malate synthase G [SAR324 cluster bacterium]
ERGKKVIEYARNFLDENVPLEQDSWKDISEIPKIYNGKLSLKLKNFRQFAGYSGKPTNLSSLLLKNNNLHIDIIFDPNGSNGRQDKAGIQDIIIESAITTIVDHEDSVAAVDAEDKVTGYRNWLGLMKGDLQAEIKKNGKKITRKLNPDRIYINAEQKGKSGFSKLILRGRA